MVTIMFQTRQLTAVLALAGTLMTFCAGLADPAAASSKNTGRNKVSNQAAAETAKRYAEAIAKGDRLTVGQLDFACQYRLVTASQAGRKASSVSDDPSYETCWKELTAGHASTLKRTDIGIDMLWPSTGPLVFYGDQLSDTQASAFVMDAIGTSPPGSGLQLTIMNSRRIPDGSFRLKPNGKVIGVPTTLVSITVHYRDPLTAPVTYAPGTVQWTNTVKRPRRAVKSVATQWVVFTGLKKHGFPGDATVFHRPVETMPEAPGMTAEQIPFATEISRALPESLAGWGPNDQPGTLTAAAARAASFPDLRDRVALLNRVLIIDPNQADALRVLTKNLYAVLLREAANGHNLTVKDPTLSLIVNEFY